MSLPYEHLDILGEHLPPAVTPEDPDTPSDALHGRLSGLSFRRVLCPHCGRGNVPTGHSAAARAGLCVECAAVRTALRKRPEQTTTTTT